MKNLIILSILFLTTISLQAQKLYDNPDHLWKASEDEVYLQEVSQKIFTNSPIQSVAEIDGECYAVMNNNIYILADGDLTLMNSAPKSVNKLINENGILWVLSSNGLYKLGDSWILIDSREFVDLTTHLGTLHAATKEEIYKLDGDKMVSIKPEAGYFTSNTTMMMEDGSQVLADPVRLGPISKIASYSGSLYILQPGRLVLFDGKMVNQDFIDWGTLASRNTNDMISMGSRVFISTDRGLSLLRGAALTTIKGTDGLPYENTTSLEKGFDGDLWIGTTKGAIRMLKDEWHYFGADHWLPGNNVNDISVGESVVYIATDNGIGIIKYEPYTLSKKAEYYEQHISEWGHKRLGFIHSIFKGKDSEWIREISDNDGGHTAPYLVAMSYKYAVTGDQSARDEAVESFKAMVWLERITPIDGFIARAIWSNTGDKGEMARHGSGGLPAKWYPTEDGKWSWKGDTSSDEVIAHFYAVSVFHDLVAEGIEKEIAAEHLARVAKYIIENDWVYIDMDGKATRWGKWNPEYLLRPYGWVDKGLNAMEAMTFAKTALKMTGDKLFEDGFNELLSFRYQDHIVRQKNAFPLESIAPWDDNLAFRSYYTLIKYLDDPYLKAIYLRSIERTYEMKRVEHVALYHFAYGAITGNDCEVDRAVKHLREWTLDCTSYSYTNSFRDDLYPEPGYVPYIGGTKAISPRESFVTGGSRYAMNYDGGSMGSVVREPTGFLRDYWMGRYHGFIKAPTTKDSKSLRVSPNSDKKLGAEPYNGLKRPELY